MRARDALAVLLLVAVVVGEGMFIRSRLKEWRLASGVFQRTLTSLEQDLTGEVRQVYLLNFPRRVPGPFWNGYAFGIAAEQPQLELRPPPTDVAVQPVYDRSFVVERWPTVGKCAFAGDVRETLRQPHVIACALLERPRWVARFR